MEKQIKVGLLSLSLLLFGFRDFVAGRGFIDYSTLHLIAIEKTKQVKLRSKSKGALAFRGRPGYGITIQNLQPKKGEYALILMVKVENKGSKYIRNSCNCPGSIIDIDGREYIEKGDAIVGRPKDTRLLWQVTDIFIKKFQWVSVMPPDLALARGKKLTGKEIPPGKSFRWIFVFHIPKEKQPKKFLFEYVVCEKPGLVRGASWGAQSSILLTHVEEP